MNYHIYHDNGHMATRDTLFKALEYIGTRVAGQWSGWGRVTCQRALKEGWVIKC